jgi:hypothetical protein
MKVPADGWDREEREALGALREPLAALQARHQNDPDIDLLRAAHHDVLPPDLQTDVAHRLTHDPWARALVEGLDGAEPTFDTSDQDRLLARIQRDTKRQDVPGTRWAWLRTAFAGAVLVAVAAIGWIAYRGSSPPPSTVAPVPEQTVASTPTKPAFQLPLDKPEVTLSLAALTWRGGGASNPFLKDLKGPLDAFREEEYAAADRGFTALEPRYPEAVEVFFYGGVSRLFLNEPARALISLTKASELADATFAPQVSWYRAIAAERTSDTAAARRLLEALCGGSSERAAAACEAIKRIDAPPSVPRR